MHVIIFHYTSTMRCSNYSVTEHITFKTSLELNFYDISEFQSLQHYTHPNGQKYKNKIYETFPILNDPAHV